MQKRPASTIQEKPSKKWSVHYIDKVQNKAKYLSLTKDLIKVNINVLKDMPNCVQLIVFFTTSVIPLVVFLYRTFSYPTTTGSRKTLIYK